jgi:RNA polymerase sigma factor (sigma-70 family)
VAPRPAGCGISVPVSGVGNCHATGCDRRPCGHLPIVDFEELYRGTYPRVLAYARSMASREDADDAVAETYAIAWRRQHDIPRGAELGWVIGVARRVLANSRRSRRRAGALHALLDLQPRAPGPDPADRVEDGELRAALLALSPLDREAVVLTAWFDLSSADAARALGVTPAAFRMRAARARRRLRAALNPTMTKESPRWNTT